ncbi:MAG: alkane 1-monooxygenase [Nevskiales bacterium]|nr:alkane 1-monooxygenase [Nevskiales bacterium]
MSAVMTTTRWHDPKRYLWLLGVPVMLLPMLGGWLVDATGLSLFWWFMPLIVYLVVPVADLLVGEDRNNPPESAVADLEKDRYYRWAVYAAVPMEYATLIWGAWVAGTESLAWWEYLGLAISVGMVTGISIAVAHELGHKTDPFEQWLAKIALAPTGYGHFYTEHNRGHHVRVATPEDPASSRYGESFYAFLPRTIAGAMRSAWKIEKARMQRRGLPTWHWRNDALNAWAMTPILFGALIAAFGWIVLPYLLIQAVYGFSLLEVVNYLEHYGLCRKKLPSGRYERCQPTHSWNSNHVFSNVLLYGLERHSDHHANPLRGYEALRHFEDSPQLPNGYAGMILLAYCPPLWFAVMNRKVRAHYGGDLTKANVVPRLRAKLGAPTPA